MKRLTINAERLLKDLKHLSSFGALPDGGINRPTFSAAYSEAASWLCRRMKDAGMTARIDAAGNVIGRVGPEHGPALICGSHIDTVPKGGALDGSLGVIAGLECARVLREAGAPLQQALEVVAFADEEGAYFSMLGSLAMTGTLNSERASVAKDREGRLLSEVMSHVGLDIRALARAARPARDFAGYLELHIEQGPVLESKGINIGIVDSIVGVDVAEYVVEGESRHAGTTPMDERKDAARAACEAVTNAFDLLSRQAKPDARITFGALKTAPGASNVVPRQACLLSEVRASRQDDIARLRSGVDEAFERAVSRYASSLTKRHLSFDVPSHMSREMTALIAAVCTERGQKFMVMPSGASHDATNFAGLVPTGMIFVASRKGISHHPDEFTDPPALLAGAEILLATIQRLVGRR